MSIKVMEWVWRHSRARDGQLLVLLAIADCANDSGSNAFPSIAELRRKSRLSERGVRNALRGLEKLGEVVTEQQQGPRGCNRYRVVMAPATSAPRQDLPPGNLRRLRGQSATGNVSQTAPVTVIEPSTNRQKNLTSEVADATPDQNRPDVERLCQHLADRIVENGSKRPTITKKWRDAARLMLDNDGRTEDQVHAAIDWSQAHPFWCSNIESMPTLRRQYDRLRLQAQAELRPDRSRRQSETDGLFDRAAQRMGVALEPLKEIAQ